MATTTIPVPDSGRKLIASTRHTVGLLLIQLGLAIGGAYLQSRPGAGPDLASAHSGIVPLYVSMIALEWGLVWYVWGGIHDQGRHLLELVGGRWSSWKNVAVDLAIALPFWILWEATARLVQFCAGRKSRQDRPDSASSSLAGNCALDSALCLSRGLRGDCFPWLFPEAVSSNHRKRCAGSGSASACLWCRSRLPGYEAGRRDQRAGCALRSVGSMAQESAPGDDRDTLAQTSSVACLVSELGREIASAAFRGMVQRFVGDSAKHEPPGRNFLATASYCSSAYSALASLILGCRRRFSTTRRNPRYAARALSRKGICRGVKPVGAGQARVERVTK